jgi:hypothetical protein
MEPADTVFTAETVITADDALTADAIRRTSADPSTAYYAERSELRARTSDTKKRGRAIARPAFYFRSRRLATSRIDFVNFAP